MFVFFYPSMRSLWCLPMSSLLRPLVLAVAGVLMAVGVQAETGVSDTKITLGSSTSLSGPTSSRSIAIHKGSKLYFDRVNAAGGVLGRKIDLIAYDDGYEPKNDVENVRKLINDDKVFAIFQVYGTPGCKAVMPLIDRANIPLFAPLSGADFLRDPINPNIFAVRLRFMNEADKMISFLLKEKKVKSIGMLSQDDALGAAGRGVVEKLLDEKGMKLKVRTTYPRNTEDIQTTLEAMKKDPPDAMILWATPGPSVALIHAAQAAGLKTIFVGASIMNDETFAGKIRDVKTQVYLMHNSPFCTAQSTELYKAYSKDAAAAGLALNPETFEGYLNAAILTDALKRAGKDLTRESLRHSLESMKGSDILGIKVGFSSSNHQGIEDAPLVLVEKTSCGSK